MEHFESWIKKIKDDKEIPHVTLPERDQWVEEQVLKYRYWKSDEIPWISIDKYDKEIGSTPALQLCKNIYGGGSAEFRIVVGKMFMIKKFMGIVDMPMLSLVTQWKVEGKTDTLGNGVLLSLPGAVNSSTAMVDLSFWKCVKDFFEFRLTISHMVVNGNWPGGEYFDRIKNKKIGCDKRHFDAEFNKKERSRCAQCKKYDAEKVCAGCKKVRYCDFDCQKKNWKYHKPTCKENKK